MYDVVSSYDLLSRLVISSPLILSTIICFAIYINFSENSERKSYVNFLLPFLLFLVIFETFMPAMRILLNPIDTPIRNSIPIDIENILIPSIVYAFLLLSFFYSYVFAIKYSLNKKNNLINFTSNEIDLYSTKLIFILFLLLFLFLLYYLNSIYPITTIIEDPRSFYRETRLGFGHIYFILALTLKLIFLLSLYIFKGVITRLLIFIIISMCAVFFGSKSQVLSIIMIYILYLYFIENKSFKLKQTLIVIGSAGIILLSAFFFYSVGTSQSPLVKLLNYFDYFENFAVMFNYIEIYYMGLLSLENNFYSVIPRVIFPDKPIYFGDIRLAEEIFPYQTYLNQGAPSFSFFGTVYADFGLLSILIISLLGFVHGYFVGIFSNTRNIYSFIIILSFISLPIFAFGSVGIVVQIFNYLLSLMLFFGVFIIQTLAKEKNKFTTN